VEHTLLYCTIYSQRFENIHLYCVTGPERIDQEWTQSFRTADFGYIRLVDRLDEYEYQLGVLRAIQDSRILLETNGPYFKKDDMEQGTQLQY
jgi:hypothetical protein